MADMPLRRPASCHPCQASWTRYQWAVSDLAKTARRVSGWKSPDARSKAKEIVDKARQERQAARDEWDQHNKAEHGR